MEVEDTDNSVKVVKKAPKKGIIYLSTIPPYMTAAQVSEAFSEFGKVGRVYLQQRKQKGRKAKRKDPANRYSEGWVEFARKSVAKKVAVLMNNKQVSTKKSSKQYDSIWNIKYLSGFKWDYLNECIIHRRMMKKKLLRELATDVKREASQLLHGTKRLKKHKREKEPNRTVDNIHEN